jgi:hypothetical protein
MHNRPFSWGSCMENVVDWMATIHLRILLLIGSSHPLLVHTEKTFLNGMTVHSDFCIDC